MKRMTERIETRPHANSTRAARRLALTIGLLVPLSGLVLPASISGTPCNWRSSNSAFAADSQSWTEYLDAGNKALASENPKGAEASFRKAAELVKKQSKSQADEDKVMLQLANSLALMDQTVEARAILGKMRSRIASAHGSNSKEMAPVLMAIGSIEESAGDHQKAMDYYNQALKITESGYGPYSPAVAGALRGLGRVSNKLGDRKSAESNYKRAITILSNSPNSEAASQLNSVSHEYGDLIRGGEDSDRDLLKDFNTDILKQSEQKNGTNPNSPSSSNWQSQSQFQLKAEQRGNTNESEMVALRGIQLPSSSDVATLRPMFKVVNDNVFKDNRYRLSEPQYKRMIASDTDSLGPNHPSVANDLNGLAQLYMAQGKYAEAKPLFEKALNIYENAYGSDNLLTVNTRAALATAEFQTGNMDTAARLYQEALTKSQQVTGPNSIETAKILNGLAYLNFQRGDLDRAATLYEWAVPTTERAVGGNDPLLAACLKDYAQVLQRQGKNDKAAEIMLRADRVQPQSR
jgi:tetratricopeptide (TPR) repeat protein